MGKRRAVVFVPKDRTERAFKKEVSNPAVISFMNAFVGYVHSCCGNSPSFTDKLVKAGLEHAHAHVSATPQVESDAVAALAKYWELGPAFTRGHDSYQKYMSNKPVARATKVPVGVLIAAAAMGERTAHA